MNVDEQDPHKGLSCRGLGQGYFAQREVIRLQRSFERFCEHPLAKCLGQS